MFVLGGLIQLICYALLILILVRVVFSWIEPYPKNQIHTLAIRLTEPLLRPVRNAIPTGSGGMALDFSPMIVTFLLLVIINLAGRL